MTILVLFIALSIDRWSAASSAPVLYRHSCQPVGPYPYPLAVIPSPNERYLLISAPMHIADSDQHRIIGDHSSGKCGKLNVDALLVAEALLYSKDTFHVRKAAEPLGLIILDNCGDIERAARDLINFESCTLDFAPQLSFEGPAVTPDDVILYILMNHQASPLDKLGELEGKLISARMNYKSVIRVSENDEESNRMIRALALVLRRLAYNYVGVIASDNIFGRNRCSMFKNLTDCYEICTHECIFLPDSDENQSTKLEETLESIAKDKHIRVLVILTDSSVLAGILKTARRMGLVRHWHWLGLCSSLNGIPEGDELAIPAGSIMLAREYDLTDFYEYLHAEHDIFRTSSGYSRNPWLNDYFAAYCNRSTNCLSSSISPFQENRWLQYNDLISKVIDIYDAATFSWASKSHLDPNFARSVANIMILNYRHTSKGWRFVRVGTIRDGYNVTLDPSNIQTYMENPIDDQNSCPETCRFCEFYKRFSTCDNRSTAADRGLIKSIPNIRSIDLVHRMDLWACLLTGFTSSMIMMLFIYELYAITKICHRLPRVTPVAQSGIFLSQAVLYGVFLQSLAIFSITLMPNFYVCVIHRFLPGLACVLTYSVLFAKLLVLISARRGQYLAAGYQCMLVVLFLAIQIMVSIDWLDSDSDRADFQFRSAPEDDQNDTTGLSIVSLSNPKRDQSCNLVFLDYLKMLTLPLILTALCAMTGLLIRRNPYNHREASFIALASFISGCVWAAWICAGFLVKKDDFQDAAFGYSLLTNAFTVTVVMFLPASGQNTATGKGYGSHSDDKGLNRDHLPRATWAKYLIDQSESISSEDQRGRKQSTASRVERYHQLEKAESACGPGRSAESVHSISLQKAHQIRTNRSLDPGGSAITLDIQPARISHRLSMPTSSSMALFNSHWKSLLNDSIESPLNVVRYSLPQGTPNPVFPPLLTPAGILNSSVHSRDSALNGPEITYANLSKPSRRSAPSGLPPAEYPTYCLHKSRSSNDFEVRRKRSQFCLHSIRYRSRSFSDITKIGKGDCIGKPK